MAKGMIKIKEKTMAELQQEFSQRELPGFRAKQVYNWVYKNLTEEPEQMTNLPLELREWLQKNCQFQLLEKEKEVQAKDGTFKFLWRLLDNEKIESVYLPFADGRRSICISSQVGCTLGCKFCVTGQLGFERSLTAGEMVDQVYRMEDWLQKKGGGEKGNNRQLTNIVFMGMGEPLLNYEEVLQAIDILTAKEGFDFSIRKITISTAGIIPGITRLAEEDLGVVLSISLHAPNDKLRDQLVPVNKRYPLDNLLHACEYYWMKTRRRISFEYAMIEGINDSLEEARQLSNLLRGHDFPAHVNLIPVNPGPVKGFTPPDRRRIERFQSELERNGIACTVRVERGTDIQAACGQLGRESRQEDS